MHDCPSESVLVSEEAFAALSAPVVRCASLTLTEAVYWLSPIVELTGGPSRFDATAGCVDVEAAKHGGQEEGNKETTEEEEDKD